MTKTYHRPTFIQYKKSHINLFSLNKMKKKSIREKKRKLKEEKNKIKNILNGKKLKGKKLVISVLDTTLLCAIHGTTVENTLFEDGENILYF